jgi:hypothetical protein
VLFATFPLYPPRAGVAADIVEPPVSAMYGRRPLARGEYGDSSPGAGAGPASAVRPRRRGDRVKAGDFRLC